MISWYAVASKKIWRTQISLVCKHHWAAEWNMYFPLLCFYLKGEGAILGWHRACISTPQVQCSSLHRRGLCSQQTPSQSCSLGMDSSYSRSQFINKLYLCWVVWETVIWKEVQNQFSLRNHCCLQEKAFYSRINAVLVYKLWSKSAHGMQKPALV